MKEAIRDFNEMIHNREAFLAELVQDEDDCLLERIENQYHQEECYNIRRTPEFLALIASLDKPEALDGWIKHDGKSQPVDNDTIVEVKFHNSPFPPSRTAAVYMHWIYEEAMCGNISAYRIVEEKKPVKQTVKLTLSEFVYAAFEGALPDLNDLVDVISEYLEREDS